MAKQYLSELEAAGVPGESPGFPAGKFIVKPAVGAGSRGASSYGPAQHQAAADHVSRLHDSGHTALVQTTALHRC